MSEIATRLLQPAINMGLSEHDFWDMTIAEVDRYLTGATWRMKAQAEFDYTLSLLIGSAIGRVIGGGEGVSIEEAYPNLFTDDPEASEEIIQEKQITNSVNRFLEFAQKHNTKKSKGVEN